jgi:Ca2+-binding RTX toxin-like protein
MSGRAHGGDDNLLITSQLFGDCTLVGDAQTMSDKSRGGDDILSAANQPAGGTISLIGDAQTMSDKACGGNDTLISGTGNDNMWGDAQVMLSYAKGGNDTFVFKADSGFDVIEDFGQGIRGAGPSLGIDHIDVSALGITDFSQLNVSAFDPTTHESTITFSAGNEVVVHSQIALTERDFLFA